MKPILQKAALALFGLTIALVIGECVVRIVGLAPEVVYVEKGRYRLSNNIKIGYEPVPALDYTGKSLHFFDYRGASNSLGYRDYDHPVAKPDGAYRILILGDSIAAGQTIAKFEDTFPAILEAGLNTAGVRAEVLNFGVSGYNTQQEVETLIERGLRYEPDLVLVAYCLNDRERNDGNILKTLVDQAKGTSGVSASRSLAMRSALFRVIYYRVLKRHKQRPEAYAKLSEDTVAEYFGVLGALSKQRGFQVMVSVFPDLGNLKAYRFDDQHRFVAAEASKQGFAVHDLLEPFRACGGGLKSDRYHPNRRGHRCAGESMAAFVLQRYANNP